MYDPINNFLAQRPYMVVDGAMGTELEQRGMDIKDPLWSTKCLIEQSQLIQQIHLDYFCAGADIATTATYQATFDAFAHHGIEQQAAAQYMRQAVVLAIAARNEFWAIAANRTGRIQPLIAASIGPYGAALADGSEYRGHYALNDIALANFHRSRLEVLAHAGADLLACETIPCLREAQVLAKLLQNFPDVCAWISFSCKDGIYNCEGEEIGKCIAQLQAYPQIVAVGVNCTQPQYITSLLRQMRANTDKPLLVYPNSGEYYTASQQWHGNSEKSHLDEQADIWLAEGARLIGGCCRTGPAEIRRLAHCLNTARI